MNKRTEQARWTPKKLLSLFMALIMTLSLLPTAAFAANGTEIKLTRGQGNNDPLLEGGKRELEVTGSGGVTGEITVTIQLKDYDPDNAIGVSPGNTFTIPAKVTIKAKTGVGQGGVVPTLKLALTVNNKTISASDIINPSDSGSMSCAAFFSDNGSAIMSLDLTTVTGEFNIPVEMKSDRTVDINIQLGYEGQKNGDRTTTITSGGTSDSASITLSGFAIPVTYNKNSQSQITQTLPTNEVVDSNGNYTINSSLFGVDSDDYTLYWKVGSNRYLPGTTLTGITSALTLNASVEKNYEIRYNPYYTDVAGAPAWPDKSAGTLYTIPEDFRTPTLEGHTFRGWKVTSGKATLDANGYDLTGITGDVTLTAQWTKNGATHTVSFLPGAADAYIPFLTPAAVTDGQPYQIPAAEPTREGYTFAGWSDGQGNIYQAGTQTQNVTGDLLLTAQWTRETVSINWPTLSADSGVSFTSPAALPDSVGKGTDVSFRLKLTDGYDPATLVVTANGVALAPVKAEGGSYQYTFTADADTEISVNAPSKVAYTVMMPVGHFTAQITDVSGTAQPAGTTSASVEHGGSYTFTVTPDKGYTVKRVAVNGATIDATNGSYTVSNVTTAQTVEVVVDELPVYIVIYNSNNSQYAFQRVTAGSKATLPAAPEVEGYTFGGWYTGQNGTGDEFTAETAITGDITVYAKLTAKTYTITYDLNGADGTAPTAQDKTHGQAVQLDNAKPTREGYKFLGWGTTANATAPSYQPGDMYSVDADITLYAVWQPNTYTVTLPSGTGYSIETSQSTTVAHGDNFTFTVKVDRAYAANQPVVKVNSATDALTVGTTTQNDDGSVSYTYTIPSITENKVVSVQVKQNLVYTVTFMTGDSVYQTQEVGYGEKATRPVDPVVEGYEFIGWFKGNANGNGSGDAWDFATDTVTANTPIYAKLTPITPTITWAVPVAANGYTIEVTGTKAGAATASTLTSGDTVAYGSKVTFTITIQTGYDATNMKVGANGQLLSPTKIEGNVYTFEFTAKEDTNITVVGVERKTVTITYNDNGGYGGPVQETVNYYLANDEDNGKISTVVPKREGYDFLGWAKTNDAVNPEYSNPKTDTTKDIADFTSDTVLYAVWQAKETGVTLAVDTTAQYEGENVTLTATVKSGDASVTTGSVQFYRSTDNDATWTLLDSKTVSGGTAVLSVPTSGYLREGPNKDTYKAVFVPTEGAGYSQIESTEKPIVTVLSTAISWKLNDDAIDADANVLTIKQGDKTVDTMVAGQVYTLELPAIYALDDQGTALTVNKDYTVTWQYCNDKGVWTDYTNSGSGDTTMVDAAYSQYVFRAVVTPITGATSHFTKAAKFNDTEAKLINNQYEASLITKQTEYVALQATTTTLTVNGAATEAKNVWINGNTDKFGRDHLAQFEKQEITLNATVIDNATQNGVPNGFVNFYRYVDGSNDELLNSSPLSVGANGVATLKVAISDYVVEKGVTGNLDKFYAVYQATNTYDTSASVAKDASGAYKAPADPTANMVFIKSTTIQTPIIQSANSGKLAGHTASETTYQSDLTDLLAGISHTFTLKANAGSDDATSNWSVVALDGRTVAESDYTIKWIVKTDDNEEANTATGTTFTTKENKDGDYVYVSLAPAGNMKTGADSKKAIIGTKQGVTVTVKAIDAIDKTTETDVYQLNDIELRATVEAAGENPSMKPTGTVAFYYVDEAGAFQKLGEAKLDESTDGKMVATIATNELPVKNSDNTALTSTVTAVYLGDTTFKASDNWDAEKNEVKTDTSNSITTDHVTVYSSVVFNCGDENLAKAVCGKKGIHITARDDNFKANEENVMLTLSDIYTLDRDLTADLLAKVATLQYGVDYEVEWQKLDGASAEKDANGNYAGGAWKKIGDGPNCSIDKVEQGAAYRAMITVKATPIAKASYENYQQKDNAGRRTYYSNVLLAEEGQTTANVILSTSNRSDNFEGIVAGETVTINVLVSGTAKTTPYSKITATIKDLATNKTVAAFEENNVNGWNDFQWETKTPGFYTLTVNVNSNNGFAPVTITRELIVRDGGYSLAAKGADGKTVKTTYNGRTQGLDVELVNFTFADADVKAAAAKAWTVTYTDANGELVEPSQAGTYKAHIVLPGNTWWNEQSADYTFVIEKRNVSIEDIIAQEKVYDGTKSVDVQEIILKDAETDQTTTGLPTGTDGVINGDSVYAVATKAKLGSENAGTTTVTVSGWELRGGDMGNYNPVGTYAESITVNRSQVYGETSADVVLKAGEKLPADAVYMIDQSGAKIDSYDVLYYLHTDTQIKQVFNTNEKGLYTVVARPKQDNYKGGVTMQITVGDATSYTAAAEPEKSTTIHIGRTAELYGATNGVEVTLSNNRASVKSLQYYVNGSWTTVQEPTKMHAGRYLVKVTASTGDVAYGIYTVTKALPALTLTTTDVNYSARQAMLDSVVMARTYNNGTDFPADAYFTISGETPIGFHKAAEGNVDKQMPTDAGTYTITWHYPETADYAAHEISKSFTVKQGEVTVTADAKYRWVNGSFPEMTAAYTGLMQPADANGPDTSLSEFQVEPEFVFNGAEGFSNDLLAHVGEAKIEVTNGLSRNYRVTYVSNDYKTVDSDPQEALAIYGLPYNGSNKDQTVVYYGDNIQLYAYGDRDVTLDRFNPSSAITWTSSDTSVASVDANGVLTILKPGTFTITLTRGSGKTAISVTTPQITAMKKELRVDLPDEDKVYNGSEQNHSTTFAAYDELYCKIARADTPLDETKAARADIGTSKSSAVIESGSQNYWSQTYNGTFTINDKEVTVTPTADSLTYGENRTAAEPTAKDKAGANVALGSVFTAGPATAALTDGYNRLDTHGYEILVAGTEDMNYNVKYKTDSATVSGTPKSTVTAYDGVKFISKTVEELNDATVYGETPNVLDWELTGTQFTTRNSKDYSDNLADFNLPETFVEQDYDNCVNNADCGKFDYKAANRTTVTGSTIEYNKAVLPANRTAEPTTEHPNYTLKFGSVNNSGAPNYKLTNEKLGNTKNTTNALTNGSLGYVSGDVDGENFIEGSANIAQRPVKLTKAVDNAELYWRLPQSQLYTALLNILKAEENSTNRGLAKGHTIEDLDLSFTITIGGQNYTVDRGSGDAINFSTAGTATVTAKVGDTNYVLEGGQFEFGITLKKIQIEATYTTKTFTGFTVLIKVHNEDQTTSPLTDSKGLSYKIFKKTGNTIDKSHAYAEGTLTYQNRTAYDDKGGLCGVFTATYPQLPTLSSGETYFIQMYEYGVELKTNS